MPRCSYLPMACFSNYQYNLGVKGQVKLRHNLLCDSSFISTTESVHIWHNDFLLGVDYNIGVLSPLCHLCQKTRSNIFTISQVLVTRTSPSFVINGVHTKHNYCLWCVNGPGVKG